MKILGIGHVGVVVESIEKAMGFHLALSLNLCNTK